MSKIIGIISILALIGCAGRDGTNGPIGPEGPPGPAGPAGPPGSPAPGIADGSISGLVSSTSGPVAGARVETEPPSAAATTGANGRFLLDPVPVGIYTVVVSLDGFETERVGSVNVRSGQTTEITTTLTARTRGFLRGTVRYANGSPADAIAVSTDRYGFRTQTDTDGAYELEVPAALYTVLATSWSGTYQTAVANNVRVPAGGSVTIDLTMQTRRIGTRSYVGSSACAECHPNHLQTWADTLHANTIRGVDDQVAALGGSVISSWTGTVAIEASPGVSVQVELRRVDGRYIATLIDGIGGRRELEVVKTQGGGSGWRQIYHVALGGLFYPLPIQWLEASRSWAGFQVGYWFNSDGSPRTPIANESFEQNCVGCHSTGLEVAHDAARTVTSVRFTEASISCEACHGPGSQHILSRNAADIFNPRRLLTKTAGVFDGNGNLLDAAAFDLYRRANETCAQCHQRGKSNAASDFQSSFSAGTHEYPYIHARGSQGAYRPGDPLSWYLSDDPLRWEDTGYDAVRSSRGNNQQWPDLLESGAAPGGHARNPFQLVACFDCHNPHGSPFVADTRQSNRDNSLCLSCHGGFGPFAPQAGESVEEAALRHTHHFNYRPQSTGEARCTGCHMPRTAQSAVPRDIASHTFAIIAPHESRDMRSAGKTPVPNSCDNCHRNDADLGVLRFELFFGAPAPAGP